MAKTELVVTKEELNNVSYLWFWLYNQSDGEMVLTLTISDLTFYQNYSIYKTIDNITPAREVKSLWNLAAVTTFWKHIDWTWVTHN